MVILTEYDFGSSTKDELYQHAKEIARKQGITKGLSKLSKRELADFIFEHSEESLSELTVQPVTEPTTQPVIESQPKTTGEEIQPSWAEETEFLKTETIEIANYPVQIQHLAHEFKVAIAWDKTNFEPLVSEQPFVTYFAIYNQVRDLISDLTAIKRNDYTIYENGSTYSIWLAYSDQQKDGFPTLESALSYVNERYPQAELTTPAQTTQTSTITQANLTMTAYTEKPTPEQFAKQLVPHWQASQATANESDRKRMWQECFDMCDNLQAFLLKSYAESTVWKTFTQQYRKAIATESGLLDPTVKGGYLYTAYPMAFWKVDQGSRTDIDNQTKIAVNTKKQNAVRVPVQCRETLLSLANDFLLLPSASNQDIWKKALAISLLTGRRFYVEVCRNAQFYQLDKVVDFNRTLGFTGQAKGGIEKAEQVYELPTYVENINLLIKNTETIQNFVKSKDWYTETLTSKEFQSKIKSQCELALRPFNDITMPYGFLLTIKDLRALYMAFCYYDYKVISGRYPDMDSYIGSIAGHDVTTDNGTYYRVGTTEHYKGFIDARWDD